MQIHVILLDGVNYPSAVEACAYRPWYLPFSHADHTGLFVRTVLLYVYCVSSKRSLGVHRALRSLLACLLTACRAVRLHGPHKRKARDPYGRQVSCPAVQTRAAPPCATAAARARTGTSTLPCRAVLCRAVCNRVLLRKAAD